MRKKEWLSFMLEASIETVALVMVPSGREAAKASRLDDPPGCLGPFHSEPATDIS